MGNFKVYTLLKTMGQIAPSVWKCSKTPSHWKSKDFPTCGFQKKFQTHPHKPVEAEPSFGNVCLPPAKLRMLFVSLG